MIKSMRMRPFEVHVMETGSLLSVPGPQTLSPMGRITGRGDGPVCSREQIERYEKHWEEILPPKVVKQVKRKGGVIHGSWSVNQQVGPRFSRKVKDVDIWVKQPKERAEEMENEIDRCIGCDIAEVKEEIIARDPNRMVSLGPLREKPASQHTRAYVKIRRGTDVGGADYSTFPDEPPEGKIKLRTKKFNGVQHETLQGAYERALNLRMRPLRSAKASRDIKRIEKYWESRRRRGKARR